jgi:tetratricopeptide (TPR) repeat protein
MISLSENNLGSIYEAKGDLDITLVTNYWEALSIFETIFGQDHAYVGTVHCNISIVQERLKNYEEAKREYGMSLAIQEKILGKQHPDTVVATLYLRSLEVKGDFKSSLSTFIVLATS